MLVRRILGYTTGDFVLHRLPAADQPISTSIHPFDRVGFHRIHVDQVPAASHSAQMDTIQSVLLRVHFPSAIAFAWEAVMRCPVLS